MADGAPRARANNNKKNALTRARVIELHEELLPNGKQRSYREIESMMAAEGRPVSKKFIGEMLRPIGQAVSDEAKAVVVARVAKTVDVNVDRMERMANWLSELALCGGTASDGEEIAMSVRVSAARGAADVSAKLLDYLGPDKGSYDLEDVRRKANDVYGFDPDEGAGDAAAAGNGHVQTH